MKEILTGNTHEKWQQIKTHPFYAEDLAELRAMGEKYLTDDIPLSRLVRNYDTAYHIIAVQSTFKINNTLFYHIISSYQ